MAKKATKSKAKAEPAASSKATAPPPDQPPLLGFPAAHAVEADAFVPTTDNNVPLPIPPPQPSEGKSQPGKRVTWGQEPPAIGTGGRNSQLGDWSGSGSSESILLSFHLKFEPYHINFPIPFTDTI